MTNATQTYTVAFEDAYYRKHRVTFERAHHGAFPKMVRLERLQDNGKDTFWTQYRACCHGEMSNSVKIELKRASEMVRWQA